MVDRGTTILGVPHFETGTVARVLPSRGGIQRLVVDIGGAERRAAAYPSLVGPLAPGDRVVVNTTALDLALGTGGEDFVLWPVGRSSAGTMSGGHVMKLRYTPIQTDVLVAEAPESRHHAALEEATSLEGMPVVACGLHSQVAAAAAVAKARDPAVRVAYVMTDGGALPLAMSNLVADLTERGLLDATLTCGHAFGGKLECVNVFSALLAARWVARCDLAIVSIGPGVVGTGTPLGHTGMDQGQSLAAAGALGGAPVAALRISFADPRPRHRVVSHHSVAALRFGTLFRCTVAVPALEPERARLVAERLERSGITARHDVEVADAGDTMGALEAQGLAPTTMGRKPSEDPEIFLAAGAAAAVGLSLRPPRDHTRTGQEDV
ncbi:MAG TPA: DUF3866 family protein [Actinomycetota bacterium]